MTSRDNSQVRSSRSSQRSRNLETWAQEGPLSQHERTINQSIATAVRLRTILDDLTAVQSIEGLFRHFAGESGDEDADAFLEEAESHLQQDRELLTSNRKMLQVSLSEIGKAMALIPDVPGIVHDNIDAVIHDFQEVFGEVYDHDLEEHFNQHFEEHMYEHLYNSGWFEHFLGRAIRWRQRRRDNR